MTYQDLLQETLATSVIAEPEEPGFYNEIEIQSHWFAGHFSDQFEGNSGQKVRIISAGEWNRGAGPDFLNATIEIDGVTLSGPIELDLNSQNWELHGHAEAETFDDVILHVVLQDSGPRYFTRTSSHRNVPRIILSNSEVREALGRPRLSQALARPGLCLAPLANLSDLALHSLLKEAAMHRAQVKALRFQRTANRHGESQALWEALADCLGFAANRLPMRLLAQRLPVKTLRKFSAHEMEAILFGTAGFLAPDLHESAPADSREYLESLWNAWWKHRDEFEFPPERSPKWSATGSRPGNHPQRRLAALVKAAQEWPKIFKLSQSIPPWKKLEEQLGELEHEFWTSRHTLKSAKSANEIRLMGASRITEFFINTLYPIRLAEGESVWASYETLRGSAPNQKLKRCAERLFGSVKLAKPPLKFAWQQQALLQIYHDFCLEDHSDCENCPFPQQLGQWAER